jgi:hypothetical protein
VTPRAANLVTTLALVGLVMGLTFTAPRWARFMRQPVAAPPEEDLSLAGRREEEPPEGEAERTI